MLCVEVASVLQLRLRLASSTGSAKIVRAPLRMPPLVPAVTSSREDTWHPPHPLSVRELQRQSGIYLKLSANDSVQSEGLETLNKRVVGPSLVRL